LRLFSAHFHDAPNSLTVSSINSTKAKKHFIEAFRSRIWNHYFFENKLRRRGNETIDHYLLDRDLLVSFNSGSDHVTCCFRKTPPAQVEEVVQLLQKFKERQRTKREIHLIHNDRPSLGLRAFEVSKPKLSIADNYNDDFQEVHRLIFRRLSKKRDKGLVLLHGNPGTGKTTYIRYLISTLSKRVIFLPPNLASSITDPNLITLLAENPDSILVVEDAENILMDRKSTGSPAVSPLLNLSDGLLSDCLNVQIICSFNMDIAHLDPALLRKGRLIAKYEFTDLTAEKAQALSNKLGFTTCINGPMPLTAVYNQEEQDFQHHKRRQLIGFGMN
jgi:hypothetical protein